MSPRDNEVMLAAYGIPECGCWVCVEKVVSARPWPDNLMFPFIVCETCGNKRCPHAEHHVLPCSGSNESGQPGASRYPKLHHAGPRLTPEQLAEKTRETLARFRTRNESRRRASDDR